MKAAIRHGHNAEQFEGVVRLVVVRIKCKCLTCNFTLVETHAPKRQRRQDPGGMEQTRKYMTMAMIMSHCHCACGSCLVWDSLSLRRRARRGST